MPNVVKKVDLTDEKVDNEYSSEDIFYLNSIEVVNPSPSINSVDEGIISSQWSINLLTNSKTVCYKIDTGAQVNVLPKSMLKKVVDDESELKDTKLKLKHRKRITRLKAYNNTESI